MVCIHTYGARRQPHPPLLIVLSLLLSSALPFFLSFFLSLKRLIPVPPGPILHREELSWDFKKRNNKKGKIEMNAELEKYTDPRIYDCCQGEETLLGGGGGVVFLPFAK